LVYREILLRGRIPPSAERRVELHDGIELGLADSDRFELGAVEISLRIELVEVGGITTPLAIGGQGERSQQDVSPSPHDHDLFAIT
jgi:hypothetical protein